MRRHVAVAKNYKIKTSKRPSGSTKVRIDSNNPQIEENEITKYIRSGQWKLIICDSYEEAHEFQWYAIEKLNPFLNKQNKQWNKKKLQRYDSLISTLKKSPYINYEELNIQKSGTGIYVLYHKSAP